MILTLDLGWKEIPIDLDAPGATDGVGFFDNGDLSDSGGNLYLQIDGQEYGQLFFYTVDGQPRIELGQFRPEHGEPRPVNLLTERVPDLIARDSDGSDHEH